VDFSYRRACFPYRRAGFPFRDPGRSAVGFADLRGLVVGSHRSRAKLHADGRLSGSVQFAWVVLRALAGAGTPRRRNPIIENKVVP
jgi:hypothetical protein